VQCAAPSGKLGLIMKGKAQKIARVTGTTARASAQAYDPEARRRLAEVSARLASNSD